MVKGNKRTVLAPDIRRRQILDAATWVFARKGYRHASVADIIGRAGVARGTFYLYFKSKLDVFIAIVEGFHVLALRGLDDMDAVGAAASRAGPRAVLAASFLKWLEFFAAHREAAAIVLREAPSIDPRFERALSDLRRSTLAYFAARFRRKQELGVVSRAPSPEIVAHLQLGMFDELINAFVLQAPQTDLGSLADQLAAFEWDGMRPR